MDFRFLRKSGRAADITAMTSAGAWKIFRSARLGRGQQAAQGAEPGPVSRIPAGDVERIVVDQLRAILRAPEIVLRTWRKARQKIDNLTETEVREAIEQLYPLWDELFPAEQARIVGLLVERVDVQEDAVEIRFRVDGLRRLVEDFKSGQEAA